MCREWASGARSTSYPTWVSNTTISVRYHQIQIVKPTSFHEDGEQTQDGTLYYAMPIVSSSLIGSVLNPDIVAYDPSDSEYDVGDRFCCVRAQPIYRQWYVEQYGSGELRNGDRHKVG